MVARRILIATILLFSCLIGLGQSQAYKATYVVTFNTTDAFIDQFKKAQDEGRDVFDNFSLPFKVITEFTVLTNSENTLILAHVKSKKGMFGLEVNSTGPKQVYIDNISRKVVAQHEDGQYLPPQWMYTYSLGSLLKTEDHHSTYQLAYLDSSYVVTFCDTIPSVIHLATPIEGAPGGVTAIQSSIVNIELQEWSVLPRFPVSWPDLQLGMPATEDFFYFLPDEEAMWQRLKGQWQDSKR